MYRHTVVRLGGMVGVFCTHFEIWERLKATVGKLPEPFQLHNRHPTSTCKSDEIFRSIGRLVCVYNHLYCLLPVAVDIKILGTHCANNVLNVLMNGGIYTRGVGDATDNTLRTPDILVHGGRLSDQRSGWDRVVAGSIGGLSTSPTEIIPAPDR